MSDLGGIGALVVIGSIVSGAFYMLLTMWAEARHQRDRAKSERAAERLRELAVTDRKDGWLIRSEAAEHRAAGKAQVDAAAETGKAAGLWNRRQGR